MFPLALPLLALLPLPTFSKPLTLPPPTTLSQRDISCSLLNIGCDSSLNTDSTGYAPYNVSCPTDITWARRADSLSTHENDYLSNRSSQLTSSWSTHSTTVNLPAPPRTPVVAMALSGGGYRAMISGAGQAFQSNTSTGAVGDLVALSSYVAGLSGGSWATGSYFANQGMSPVDLVNNIWNLDSNLIFPSDDKISFYSSLYSQVQDKQDDGFQTQITDYWGNALANHLFISQYHVQNNPNLTLSSLASLPAISNASLPYPIIVAAEREPGEAVIAENATLWEFTLGEFGTWAWGSQNKTTGGFTNIKYLGTNLSNAEPVLSNQCWEGYDNLGFVVGTSSTLFNGALLELNSTDTSSLNALENAALEAVEAVLNGLSSDENDIATYVNPFYQWQDSSSNPTTDLSQLQLVDAGETNQNVPLEPFLIPYRNVDAILAFDNSADTTYSWPNGSALQTTYDRAAYFATNYDNATLRMPKVPSTNGFVNGGLNTRPTFFGCNDTTTPVIIYIPNYPWSTASNTSTYMLDYSTEQALAVVDNGARTLNLNGSISDWPTCLTCAMTYNAIHEANGTWSSACQNCFDRFCWNGVDNTTQPAEYEPAVGVAPAFVLNDANYTGGASTTAQVTSTSGSTSVMTLRNSLGMMLVTAVAAVMAL